jgi:pimeloyl-ACP methyl ester carboxylesterase
MKPSRKESSKAVLGERNAWLFAPDRKTSAHFMKAAALIFLTVLCVASPAAERGVLGVMPSQPKQPDHGPGGSEYSHRGVKQTEYGEGGRQFWIIEPARPAPKQAPLIIFIHGWSAMHPDTYRGWIDHLARHGNIVVYPRYQERLFSPAAEYFPNIVASVRSALDVLKQADHVAPDLSRVAVVGHSVGGVEVVNYAAAARAEGLPVPNAVMSVEPGQGAEHGIKIVPMNDCGAVPAGTKLIVMIADADGIVGSECARTIWRGTAHVKERAFVTLRSDRHGFPPLTANHLSPVSWNRAATDALDWFGFWRLFDSLTEDAFAGRTMQVDPAMGTWSDGAPVMPLQVER